MKIVSVVGARPNFMKVAPLLGAIEQYNDAAVASDVARERILHVLVHTGQHYDQLMSDSFFADLSLPEPDFHLGAGSGSHAVQTAEVMRKFEQVLLAERPDVVVVVGDVNSTLACALVTAKISFDTSGSRPIIAHVESGLRSRDRTMPEEINRILTDQLSDLLFVTERSGLTNLVKEGVPSEKVHFVGNTMIDSLLAYKERADQSTILQELSLRNAISGNGSSETTAQYALLTLHRPANVDNRQAFLNIVESLLELAGKYIIVFPAHPRTQKRIKEFDLERYFSFAPGRNERGTIRTIDPLGYLDFVCLMKNAAVVVTDSGGIQEETTCLNIPCVTIRENTERPVTIEVGTNVLAGVTKAGIQEAIKQQLDGKRVASLPELWDGRSAARIVDVITREWRDRRLAPIELMTLYAGQSA